MTTIGIRGTRELFRRRPKTFREAILQLYLHPLPTLSELLRTEDDLEFKNFQKGLPKEHVTVRRPCSSIDSWITLWGFRPAKKLKPNLLLLNERTLEVLKMIARSKNHQSILVIRGHNSEACPMYAKDKLIVIGLSRKEAA